MKASTTNHCKPTAVVRDQRFLDHITEEGHPENAGRLAAVYEMLDTGNLQNQLLFLEPREADRENLIRVHAPLYVDKIAATALREFCRLTPDTTTSPGSYLAARLAAGGTIGAIEAVHAGSARNAFVIARPPGHHAENSKAMGYCLFNNIAVGAAYAVEELGYRRVLIVDWDLHHGNGTQHIFEADDKILFFSIHQHPLFPGTGLFTDVGLGRGEGYTCNIPLSRGYGDAEYLFLFENALHPMAAEFKPELILVSAGFDTYHADPLGGMAISRKGFADLTRSLLAVAERLCHGKIVFALEGGYHHKGLPVCIQAVLQEMLNPDGNPVEIDQGRLHRKKANYALKRCHLVHRGFWKCFQEVSYG